MRPIRCHILCMQHRILYTKYKLLCHYCLACIWLLWYYNLFLLLITLTLFSHTHSFARFVCVCVCVCICQYLCHLLLAVSRFSFYWSLVNFVFLFSLIRNTLTPATRTAATASVFSFFPQFESWLVPFGRCPFFSFSFTKLHTMYTLCWAVSDPCFKSVSIAQCQQCKLHV